MAGTRGIIAETRQWARRGALLALLALALGLLTACGPAPAAGPLVEAPTASPLPRPTGTTPPPPKPTTAPPALSPAGSPSPLALALATPKPRPRARVGVLGGLSDLAVQIAHEREYFAQQGLDTQLVPFATPAALLAALGSGQLEAGCVTIGVELFTAIGRLGGPILVAEAGGAPPGRGAAGLAVRPELAERLRTPTDLRGFRIGLPTRGDPLEVELTHLLRQGWLARTDVETLQLPPLRAGAMLAEGTLDGAMLAEPYLSEVEQLGLAVAWRRSDQIVPNHQTAALVFASRFARHQPDAARGFLTAYLKAARQYNDVFVKGLPDEREALLPIVSRAASVDGPERLELLVLPGLNPNGMLNIQTLRLDQRYFLASGQLQREVNLAASIDSQYTAYAITQLGEYR